MQKKKLYNKSFLRLILFYFISSAFPSIVSLGFAQSNQSETLTITTYYPSPYGVYRNLEVKRGLAIGDITKGPVGSMDNLAQGQLYINGSVVLNALSTYPPTPWHAGQVIYYVSGTNKMLKYHNGTDWINLTTCPPSAPACGSAAKTYPIGSASYGTDTFCDGGTLTPATPLPLFPPVGGSRTWQCVTGTFVKSCTAYLTAPSPKLVLDVHTEAQCSAAGGAPFPSDVAGKKLCMFSGSSCLGGLAPYKSFTGTTSVSCAIPAPYTHYYCCGAAHTCVTTAHGFANAAQESCTVGWNPGCSDTSCVPNPQPVCHCTNFHTCYSTIDAIGCY